MENNEKIALDCKTCNEHKAYSRDEFVPMQCPTCGGKDLYYKKEAVA